MLYRLSYRGIVIRSFLRTRYSMIAQNDVIVTSFLIHNILCNCNTDYTFKTSYRFPINLWSSPRSISNSQLHTLPCFHLCPIYLVLFKGSYFLMEGISHLEGGFTLRCLQRLSLPDLATLPCRWSTADTPVVRPSRSSRTKDSSSQISSARAG